MPRRSLQSISTPTRGTEEPASLKRSQRSTPLHVVSSATPRTRPRKHAVDDEIVPEEPIVVPTTRGKRKRGNTEGVVLTSEHVADNADGVNGPTASTEFANPTEIDPEKELEAWQDFAIDHYEVVEQLPLELHRNYRLMRELDEGCITQTEKLLKLIREYIALRQKMSLLVTSDHNEAASTSQLPKATEEDGNPVNPIRQTTPPIHATPATVLTRQTNAATSSDGAKQPGSNREDHDVSSGRLVGPEAMGIPLPDGDGGLVLPADPTDPSSSSAARLNGIVDHADAGEEEIEEVEEPVEEGRRSFPSNSHSDESSKPTDGSLLVPPRSARAEGSHGDVKAVANEERRIDEHNNSAEVSQAVDSTANGESRTRTPPMPTQTLDQRLQEIAAASAAILPEIAKLAKEVVRNSEEKVAVAIGAYNSVDRHIRALDSALSAQEASILLGLRPATHPSAAIGGDLLISGEADLEAGIVVAGQEEQGLSIGIGGGAGGRGKKLKGRKNKGRKSGDGQEGTDTGPGVLPLIGAPPVILDADPSEPRYCYCNQVSYGQMIGCDNDDCELEWFHLICAGLTAAPVGRWLCEVCKGNIPLSAIPGQVGYKGNEVLEEKIVKGAGGRGHKKR